MECLPGRGPLLQLGKARVVARFATLVSEGRAGIYPESGTYPPEWPFRVVCRLGKEGHASRPRHAFPHHSALLASPAPSQEEVGDILCEMLASVVRFDHVVVFAYPPGGLPVHVYSTFDAPQFDIFVTQYLEGPYLLDPFYRNALLRRDGVWRMRELAPDRFFSSEYVRSYYSRRSSRRKSATSSPSRTAAPSCFR